MKIKLSTLTTFLLLVFASHLCFSQVKNKIKFTLPVEIKKIEIPQKFKKYDAVILEEQLYISTNNKTTRHVRIKIQTENGLKEYRKICLPESQDPIENNYLVSRYKTEAIHYPLGGSESIIYFAARIIKPDYSSKEIIVRDSTIKHTWYEFGTTRNYFNFYYIFDELKVGDEIDIYYAYSGFYYPISITNHSFNSWKHYRYFFNEKIPKVEYSLALLSAVNRSYEFYTFEQNALPTDTTYTLYNNKKIMQLHWRYKNLEPINNLWNSHLHEDLPHIKIYYGGVLKAKDSNKEFFEVHEYSWNYALSNLIGVKRKYDGYDRNFSSIVAYNNLYGEVLATCPDTAYINRVNFFHEHINNNFSFLNDVEFISGDDVLNTRLGKFTNAKKLRRIGRFDLYQEILDRFDVPYYLVAIADKRVDIIDFKKFNYGFGIPGIYCVTYKGVPYFIQPKNHQFGHHMNELPFYYEGCPIILVPQREPEQKIINLGNAYSPELVFLNTPSSNEGDNHRDVISLINVSLTEQKVEFNTKLSLRGQFSTLIRGNYTNDFIDSSVNSQYYKKIYQLSAKSNLIELKKTSEDEIFPFKTNFQIKYSDNSLLSKKNDSVFVLKLTEFMQHVIEKDIDTNAFNAFYPDFKQTDIYRYFLKFDNPVKLVEPNLNINIDNTLGKYVFSVSQKSETDIMVESYLQISSDKVSPNKIKDVFIIGEQIQKKKSAEITLITQKQ